MNSHLPVPSSLHADDLTALLMNKKNNWLIPLQNRSYSGTFDCNFLWQSDQVYVMDNHRLALWCWLRHIEPGMRLNLLHMDEHYDCLMSRHKEWVAALPSEIGTMSLKEYLDYSWQGTHGPCPLFRFDNYLSLFMAKYCHQISGIYLSTHRDGDRPNFNFHEFSILECMGYLYARCDSSSYVKTILNIDIDYFTETGFDEPIVIVSRKFLNCLGKIIGQGVRNGLILCFTLALSPEFSGSWQIAEMIAHELLCAAGISFSLPRNSKIAGNNKL